MPTLTLRSGTNVDYEVSGSGAPVLQVGAGQLNRHNYVWMSSLLAQTFEVITVDVPGFGASDPPAHGGTLAGWAADVAEVIERLGCGPVHVHGISTGGSIALALAASSPTLVRRVVAGVILVRPDRAALLMRAVQKEVAQRSGMRAVADLTIATGYSRAYLDSARGEEAITWMRGVFTSGSIERYVGNTQATETFDVGKMAPRIAAPVLLIGCRDDLLAPLRAGPSGLGIADLHGLLPDSQLIVLEDSGHCYYVERADEIAPVVAEFFNTGRVLVPTSATLIEAAG